MRGAESIEEFLIGGSQLVSYVAGKMVNRDALVGQIHLAPACDPRIRIEHSDVYLSDAGICHSHSTGHFVRASLDAWFESNKKAASSKVEPFSSRLLKQREFSVTLRRLTSERGREYPPIFVYENCADKGMSAFILTNRFP
jgi:hypothetical protein